MNSRKLYATSISIKITICSVLFLFLLATGMIVHHMLKVSRLQDDMIPPVSVGSYYIYNNFDGKKHRVHYSPYLPREYVRIVEPLDHDPSP